MKKGLLSVLAFILVTVIIVSCEKDKAPSYNATFKVLDGDKPIPNTTVEINNITKVTSTAGEVVFEELQIGSYGYSVKKDDYNPLENGLITIENADIIEIVKLDLTLVDVVFYVGEYMSDIKIANAQVEIEGYEPKLSDVNGNVTFAVVPNSKYRLTITTDGYATYTDDNFRVDDYGGDRSISLMRACNITFIVTQNNNPVADASINIEGFWDSPTDESSTTDENGMVTFEKVLSSQTLLYTIEKGNQGDYDLFASERDNMEIGIELGEIAKDIDGNMYKVVTIGTQKWMASNLRTTSLNDGTTIPNIENDTEWKSATSPGLCWYEWLTLRKHINYGALYNWYCVETDKLCPDGWHVATVEEWNTLEEFIKIDQGVEYVGRFMKSSEGWNQDGNGTDDYGLAIYPAGHRSATLGHISAQENGAELWMREAVNETSAHNGWLNYSMDNFMKSQGYKWHGYSVRCIAD